jgi:hypothetical protein
LLFRGVGHPPFVLIAFLKRERRPETVIVLVSNPAGFGAEYWRSWVLRDIDVLGIPQFWIGFEPVGVVQFQASTISWFQTDRVQDHDDTRFGHRAH